MPFYFNYTLSSNYGQNICNLRCGSQTCTNFLSSQFREYKACPYSRSQQIQHIIFFLPLLSQELSSFHLEEALYGFSLAYLNCQCHYSGSLGPLLSKIRPTCGCDRVLGNQDGRQVTNSGQRSTNLTSRDSRLGQSAGFPAAQKGRQFNISGASLEVPKVKSWPASAGDTRDACSLLLLGRVPGGAHGKSFRCSYRRIQWTVEPGAGRGGSVHRVAELDMGAVTQQAPDGSVVKNPLQETQVWSLPSGKIPHAEEQISPGTTTIEPVSQSPGAANAELPGCDY